MSNGFSVASWKYNGVGGPMPQHRDEMSSKESNRRNSGFSQEKKIRGSSVMVDYQNGAM